MYSTAEIWANAYPGGGAGTSDSPNWFSPT
jgi:hypothetical protein